MTAYFLSLFVALDQFANVLLAPALNATLRPTAARFGHPGRDPVERIRQEHGGGVMQGLPADAPPMPLRGIALAAVVGCVGALLWVAGELVKRTKRKMKWQL